MQLSKLTFSLASLVLLMAFAFIAMPVMADDGTIGGEAATHIAHTDGSPMTAGHIHPVVEIAVMDADPATDGNQTYTGGVVFGTVFTLKFTFNHPVGRI